MPTIIWGEICNTKMCRFRTQIGVSKDKFVNTFQLGWMDSREKNKGILVVKNRLSRKVENILLGDQSVWIQGYGFGSNRRYVKIRWWIQMKEFGCYFCEYCISYLILLNEHLLWLLLPILYLNVFISLAQLAPECYSHYLPQGFVVWWNFKKQGF